ncbi:MAG TPA: dockerin type I domain-containing protein, partial [Myxococcota bacterium]|nr:dockerin type I domain-containing protein [Myxococcota bacterium]
MGLIGSRVHRWAACALGVLAIGIGPCNLTEHRSDVNADGWVDAHDLDAVTSCLGLPPTSSALCARADVIANGSIDQADLDAVSRYQGSVLFTPEIPAFVPASIQQREGVLFLHAPDRGHIYRWSLADARPMSPIYVGPQSRQIACSAEDDAIYVSYGDRRIARFDASLPLTSTPFTTLRAAPDGL